MDYLLGTETGYKGRLGGLMNLSHSELSVLRQERSKESRNMYMIRSEPVLRQGRVELRLA